MKLNICPYADRCKHAEKCICYDTFRGEYLCYESKKANEYERIQRKMQERKKKYGRTDLL